METYVGQVYLAGVWQIEYFGNIHQAHGNWKLRAGISEACNDFSITEIEQELGDGDGEDICWLGSDEVPNSCGCESPLEKSTGFNNGFIEVQLDGDMWICSGSNFLHGYEIGVFTHYEYERILEEI